MKLICFLGQTNLENNAIVLLHTATDTNVVHTNVRRRRFWGTLAALFLQHVVGIIFVCLSKDFTVYIEKNKPNEPAKLDLCCNWVEENCCRHNSSRWGWGCRSKWREPKQKNKETTGMERRISVPGSCIMKTNTWSNSRCAQSTIERLEITDSTLYFWLQNTEGGLLSTQA